MRTVKENLLKFFPPADPCVCVYAASSRQKTNKQTNGDKHHQAVAS